MLLRLLSVVFLAVALTGCAATHMKSQNEQIESRVTDLEKNLQSKDAEIVDLQYQVKDLSSKLDGSKAIEPEAGSKGSAEGGDQIESLKSSGGASAGSIIRVKASPEKIQRALKAAGVYTGRVDGRIGAGTKQAIVEFQKSHGLRADGVLGKRTWEELKVYLK